MIDDVYKIVLTILNKEDQGNVTPTQFNQLAKQVQEKIFRGYFEDAGRDKNRANRGLSNPGYGNLAFKERQRITQFATTRTLTNTSGLSQPDPLVPTNTFFALPTDTYFIEDDGITVSSTQDNLEPRVIQEVEQARINYLNRSLAKPTTTYPVYTQNLAGLTVLPTSINQIDVRYVRMPLDPKWTFMEINGNSLYNPAASDFQDFELHPSEFSNIVIELVSLFGVNLKEFEVVNLFEALKQQEEVKQES